LHRRAGHWCAVFSLLAAIVPGLALADLSGQPDKAKAAASLGFEQAVQGAIATAPEGQAPLQFWMEQSFGDPKALVRRTLPLIEALRNARLNLEQIQRAADRISRTASEILNQVHILNTGVTGAVTLGGGKVGFTFQSADAKIVPGFQPILPRDPRLTGQNLRAIRTPRDGSILQAGIFGPQSLSLPMPNGSYRIILLTGEAGIPGAIKTPFGRQVKVNQHSFDVAAARPDNSLPAAVLAAGNGALAAIGGGLILYADITTGRLDLEFVNPEGETYLCSVILEPMAEPSLLSGSPYVRALLDPKQHQTDIAEALAEIDNALGTLLSDVATAAGPQDRADQLNLSQPPAQQPDAISPN
jgi:hypothetical protein